MATPPAHHVLVIDNDVDIRDLFRDLLEGEGYRVTTRSDPDLTVAEVAIVAPDLIVLELLYGRQNTGLPFLETLKTNPITAAIPTIVCSGAPDAVEASQKQLAAWNCGIASKPFEIESILAMAQDACSRSRDVRQRSAIALERLRKWSIQQ